MSYTSTKERLRQVRQRLQAETLLPVLPILLPVEGIAGNSVSQVVAQPSVTDVTDVTDKRISHDDCDKKNNTYATASAAVETCIIFSDVLPIACAKKSGNIGNTGNAQVVELLPVEAKEPVTAVTETGNKIVTYAAEAGLNPHSDDPYRFLGYIVTQRQMNKLLDRGRREGFGVQGSAQTNEWPCDWRIVRVWSLEEGYAAGKVVEE